jgi:hypothetical protein
MVRSAQTHGINPLGETFAIYANPTDGNSDGLRSVIRFTADDHTKTVYCWNFNDGHHSDASRALGLNDNYSSPDFLKGAAERIHGRYVFVGSDFLSSFKGKLIGNDRRFLVELFSRDWSWIDQYIEITPRLRRFREGLWL